MPNTGVERGIERASTMAAFRLSSPPLVSSHSSLLLVSYRKSPAGSEGREGDKETYEQNKMLSVEYLMNCLKLTHQTIKCDY